MDERCEFDPQTGCLTLAGELTIYQIAAATACLQTAAASGVLANIDLTAVTELDCAGLQWLIQAERLVGTQQEPAIVLQKNPVIEQLQIFVGLATLPETAGVVA